MNHSLINDATALLAPAKNFESHDRRTWLKTALGMGYAAACMPLCAQTAIRTSSEGLLCGEAVVNVNGFQMPVYRSMPLGKTDCPVVLVVSEIFGVHEYIADVTRRFAHAGYLAIAPELYFRQGDPRAVADIPTLMSKIVSKVPDAQVLGDLDRGAGDPKLVMYGRGVTPNTHALAEQFVTLDHFFASGGNSADGHQWLTQANETDYPMWPLYDGRSYPSEGVDPLAYSSGGFIWEAARAKGRTVSVFGEYAPAPPRDDASVRTRLHRTDKKRSNRQNALLSAKPVPRNN